MGYDFTLREAQRRLRRRRMIRDAIAVGGILFVVGLIALAFRVGGMIRQ